jgi:F-type H+-transporting ATPase subunit delta
MHVNPVARVYAQALLEIARERGTADPIGAELEGMAAIARTSPDVGTFFATPALSPDVKKRALAAALADHVDPLIVDFLCLLVDKRRIGELAAIASAYRQLADAAAGRVRVQAESAATLPAEQRDRLVALLDAGLQRECILETAERPELLAGLVVTVGDTVYDGSVRSRLRRLRREMMRSSGYEN